MGIVNATPDSFSDAGELPTHRGRLARGRALLADGRGHPRRRRRVRERGRPAVAAEEEIARVVPVVERLAPTACSSPSTPTSPAVAAAAVAAGRGDRQRRLGAARPGGWPRCARDRRGAGDHAHARGAEGTLLDPERYDDVVADVRGFLRERMEARAGRRGGGGADPARPRAGLRQDARRRRWRCCGGSTRVLALGRPVLLAVSRKDFVGALTGRARASAARGRWRRSRTALDAGRTILRVHDVAAAADFLAVRAGSARRARAGPGEGLTPDRYPAAASR